MSVTREVLVLDWGIIDCPPDMRVAHPRKDGQPDRRYKESREWWRRFREMNERGAA